MDQNMKTYVGKRGYVLRKKDFSPKFINDIKKKLTVKPNIIDDYGNSSEEFKVYTENENKLYIPKFFGYNNVGKPEQDRLPDGENIDVQFCYDLRENQVEPANVCIEMANKKGGGIIELPCAYGKCHGINTPILMYDGTIKFVQDIKIDDKLMGDDSKPRNVISLAKGYDKMYKIKQQNGNDYIVNQEHILCLKTIEQKIIELSVKEYLTYKNKLFGYKVDINFEEQKVIVDPYIIGCWIGNNISTTISEHEILSYFKKKNMDQYFYNNSDKINTIFIEELQKYNQTNKYIPYIYKVNSTKNRLKLLSGILDTFGRYHNEKKMYQLMLGSENQILINDIEFLVRSLGFVCSYDYEYNILNIDTNPNNLLSDIEVEYIGYDNYYGFELDGNCKYLMSDFTVTHNTCIMLYVLSKLNKKSLIVVHKEFLLNQWKDRINQFLPGAKVGIIQQNNVDIDNKDIVIAMLQSISMKEYANNTFDCFDTVVVDECFVGNTYVLTSNGTQRIDELYKLHNNFKEIPFIVSYNIEKDKFEYKKLTQTWKKQYLGNIYNIIFDNGIKIKCTPEHKILTKNGYKMAMDLDLDDDIISYNNNKIMISSKYLKIDTIKIFFNKCYVYDIEVEDNHNFIVSNNISKYNGIVVHNCHHISSRVFSRALKKINSKYMFGLSATPNRKDGLTKVFKWYLGDTIYKKKHIDTNIVKVERLILQSDNEYYNRECLNFRGKPEVPKMINNIAANLNRTKIIVYWIKELLDEDRKILVLSDRRGHLEDINKLLYDHNIKSVGFYVGSMKQIDLDISATKSVILGTYPVAMEGLDIPGLDTLILTTPKSDIIQAVGRILRKKHEENQPKIIDLVDTFSLFESQANIRNKLYVSRNYIVDDITLCDTLKDDKPNIISIARKQNNFGTKKNINTTKFMFASID